jgi:L-ribulose-5-phosphate 4-epimerase
VLFTWGNVSEIDRKSGYVVIKPSGFSYDNMKIEDLVVIDLNGKVVEGKHKPSSDTPTHLELYKAFADIGGIAHTHSTFATAWAQAGRDIPFYGTTHADYFNGFIPCSRALTKTEVESNYEKNTALVIAERFKEFNPVAVPAILIKSHGVFAFGTDAENSVYHAAITEEVAKIAMLTKKINPHVKPLDKFLLEKHYNRKHGKNAYYGQEK